MEFRTYKLSSYDEYYKKYLPELKSLCREKKVHIAYIMALNEAVCNAFRYNTAGEYKGEAVITVAISNNDILCRVYADTNPFDPRNHFKKVQELANNPATCELDWGDYTQDQEGGRGLWYMLYGTDALTMDVTSHEVALFISYPSSGETRTKKIKNLAKKFFIKKNGVCY